MGVGVAVGVGVLVGVRVGIAVAVGVVVGIAVAVGESVGVEDGVLVGAGVKVRISMLIGDGVPSAPQKQAGANATGSVRNAMRITYGRRIMASPRLVQGVDRHDVEGGNLPASEPPAHYRHIRELELPNQHRPLASEDSLRERTDLCHLY